MLDVVGVTGPLDGRPSQALGHCVFRTPGIFYSFGDPRIAF
jgi:hypothetical protein